MELVCSPKGILDLKRPGQGALDLAGAGFCNVLLDFSMACPAYELERVGKKRKKPLPAGRVLVSEHPQALALAWMPSVKRCLEEKLHMPAARAPYLRRDTKRGDLTGLLVELIVESIKACGRLGSPYLILRPASQEPEFYLQFAALARENGVTLLLENVCRDFHGHLIRGFFSDVSEICRFLDTLNERAGEERFGFCMDVGACSVCGQDMQGIAVRAAERMKAVVVRDCDGSREGSMLAFTSVNGGEARTDWLGFIRGLRESGFDGLLILDLEDTAVSFSPVLRPQLLRLAKSVGEYLKWQVGIAGAFKRHPSLVLFGAGNMCRNYMKCYGEAYPPLYTCDNNRALWGERFCGLEVKPPEALQSLPKDCAIVICNIYYREIERQLRGMGIKNPIEFFNDEYMPEYYFDRVEERMR